MSDSKVLNICFHGVGEPQREMEPGEDVYWVTADRFEAILDEVSSWPVPVRLSFDDGNASDVEIGLPGLVERGLTAEFFLLAGRLDTPGSIDSAGVAKLRAAGMPVGSHGMAHRSWRGLTAAETVAEFDTARTVLAEAAGAPVDTAACPLGRYDRRVITELRRRGYTRVYTSDRRPARADSWLQPRYSVRHHDTPESLRAEVLAPAPLPARARALAVGAVKRWR
ncbi:glycosyl transferase [Actinoplanes sp. OR16]|uniref:polysaccharide deacetylase family protein n=1 Tax=Actinoplanes sp. OR16 TaxID=946334 RepID=UPI000F6BB774|nr:polysaccharide deacetylase family protein [Actinoplanes sp. OR16]BBH68021.1 glycosyl transferase [Actinoplanes sp. OR16]